MTDYIPDNWVVLKIPTALYASGFYYKILAGWSGGYLDGDAWRMNSGITKCTYEKGYYFFYGSSGSCYICHEDSYTLRMNNSHIYEQIKDKVVLMPEETNWLELKYE